MDRQIVYPGSIPLDTDLLNIQRNAMIAFGTLTQAILGSSPVAAGLQCTPAAAGYAVTVGAGSVSMSMATDASAFGSLATDPTPIVKTGVLRGGTQLPLSAWPDTTMVLCWLIQATLQEVDSGPVALPYWNAANPAVPYSGPNNSGTAQNTQRLMQLTLSAKSSAPVPVGTFAPPTADPGSIGLWGVTTWAGKTNINTEDIQQLPEAPFLPFQLPNLTPGFSRQELHTTGTNWVVPSGVQLLRVRLVGGGGGGGGSTNSGGGGGGGAGGYAEAILAVAAGQSHVITVGAGGSLGTPTAAGGTGGTTSFGTLVSASGGQGGGSVPPNNSGGGGGVGLVGALLQFGGFGGDGPSIAGVPAGNGGSSVFGGGGRGTLLGGPPAGGQAAGSGAGGGYGSNSSGGTGSAGLVILEY